MVSPSVRPLIVEMSVVGPRSTKADGCTAARVKNSATAVAIVISKSSRSFDNANSVAHYCNFARFRRAILSRKMTPFWRGCCARAAV